MPLPISFTPDIEQLMSDTKTSVAGGAATVGGVPRIFKLGPGLVDGMIHIQTTALDVSSGDERYDILVQGSNDPVFGSGIVPLGQLQLGKANVINGTISSPGAADYCLCFVNDYAGVLYQYIRVFTVVVGTTPSITWQAWLDGDPL